MNKKIIYNQVGFFGSCIMHQLVEGNLGIGWFFVSMLYGVKLIYILFKKNKSFIIMKLDIKCNQIEDKEDYYNLSIKSYKDEIKGTFSREELRNLIEIIDNSIL